MLQISPGLDPSISEGPVAAWTRRGQLTIIWLSLVNEKAFTTTTFLIFVCQEWCSTSDYIVHTTSIASDYMSPCMGQHDQYNYFTLLNVALYNCYVGLHVAACCTISTIGMPDKTNSSLMDLLKSIYLCRGSIPLPCSFTVTVESKN